MENLNDEIRDPFPKEIIQESIREKVFFIEKIINKYTKARYRSIKPGSILMIV